MFPYWLPTDMPQRFLPAQLLKGELGTLYQQRQADHGHVSELYQLVGNSPDCLVAFSAMSRFIRMSSSLSSRQRELITVRTAAMLGLGYALRQHAAPAEAAGISPAEVEALGQAVAVDSFAEPDRSLLSLVDALVEGGSVQDEVVDAAARTMTNQQLVDVMLTVGWYRLIGCLIRGFDLDDSHHE
jgi:AhpD family alkylhydroperoxidase